MDENWAIEPGDPSRLGATLVEGGVNFAVFSRNAEAIHLCLYDAEGAHEIARLALPGQVGPIWTGFVPGLTVGARYGLRAHGPFAPESGHRFNANKLLIDPYARAVDRQIPQSNLIYGYMVGHRHADLSFDMRDSGPVMPKSIVVADAPPAGRAPFVPWSDTLIYEAHVKGLTRLHPHIDAPLRGTYEALGDPVLVDHLKRIGVTALELMPIQAMHDDHFLVERGLVNYWGYNTFGFFMPAPRYCGPNGEAGLRDAIGRLHDAGIEVILDVVYNHTAESDHLGPTLSFRGLDNASYYRLSDTDPRYNMNDTGTGNMLDFSEPFVTRLAMDSLRYWVETFGIDGFRFDLMTTLGRGRTGFEADGPFLTALQQDPVLATCKIIAEPWDIGPGGYQLGAFPASFAEWNDRFRDSARRYWRNDPGASKDLASALLGSANIFDRHGRSAWASVNFVAAHDGFTTADVVAYTEKHNEANGEDNRDGHHGNFSDNFGVEGATNDPQILKRRALRIRNLLATTLVSQGTPMLLAGDELGHSQSGNNNAYPQDNETTWLDWADRDDDLIRFVADLARLRREHPALRQTSFLHGLSDPADIVWHAPSGGPVNFDAAETVAFIAYLYDPQADDRIVVAINSGTVSTPLVLPALPDGQVWSLAIDSTGIATHNSLPAECLVIFATSVA